MATLIVPLCGENNSIVFKYNDYDTRTMNCINACCDLVSKVDRVVFVMLRYVADKQYLKDNIELQLRMHGIPQVTIRDKVSFVLLDHQTQSMAETVYEGIKRTNIPEDERIIVKDGDNESVVDYASLTGTDNYVAVESLETLSIVDPSHKSYVMTDNQGMIVNAIERRVISDKFIAGIYSFSTAKMYSSTYEALLKNGNSTFYISDMIYYTIINRNAIWMPVKVEKFVDYNI